MESRERKTGATMWQQLQPTRRGPRRLLEKKQMDGTGMGSEGIFHAECEVFFISLAFRCVILLTIQMSPCGSQGC